MSNVIRGLFATPQQASLAIHQLAEKGFAEQQISLVSNETYDKDSFSISENTKFPEGVAIGAASGGVLASIGAGLAMVGSVATGGLGILAAGPIATAFFAGAGGGGILGGVFGSIFPDEENQYFEDEIVKGSVMVSVECDPAEFPKVEQVFSSCQAKRLNKSS
ncbi:hypothetical protein [Aliiglaciecola sp. LCG003]|uniref:hypothetical protein n=1 Tax=Aliiglaciecola sp. LCG003 TaxID=3053655 RepID=UPI0025732D12|nr:hypothetical protein [Aliiglaciecola sp. LCG003]WJG10308.1 hypothetical protein QR722_04535 [Aliiglaciecola sp. LCG003]